MVLFAVKMHCLPNCGTICDENALCLPICGTIRDENALCLPNYGTIRDENALFAELWHYSR